MIETIKRWVGFAPERRNAPLSAVDRWLDYLIGGVQTGPSWSGEPVDERRAQQLATVYRCVSLIAETCASLPLHVYRRGAEDSREIARNHYLYRTVHDWANPNVTAQAFRESLTRDAISRGNGCALKMRDKAGRVSGYIRMPAERTEVLWDEQRESKIFRYSPLDGPQVYLTQEDVLHVLGPTLDGIRGISVIQMYGYQAIGAALAAHKFGAKFFANGARATGVLSAPNKLSPEARANLRASAQQQISGENKLGLLLLEEGLQFQALSVSPEDAQFLETMDYQDHEICRWFGVPPVLAGVVSKTTSWGTGIEQLNIGFLQYTLQPWLKRWEGPLTHETGPGIYIEHDVAGLLRGDLKTQTQSVSLLFQRGLISRDEGRRKLGYNATGGPDVFSVPLNTGLVTASGETIAGGNADSGGDGTGRATTEPGS